jgi:hypothetical protein
MDLQSQINPWEKILRQQKRVKDVANVEIFIATAVAIAIVQTAQTALDVRIVVKLAVKFAKFVAFFVKLASLCENKKC